MELALLFCTFVILYSIYRVCLAAHYEWTRKRAYAERKRHEDALNNYRKGQF